MKRTAPAIVILLILIGCSQEDGGVGGSQPKDILDDVQLQLDQAGVAAEDRLGDAIERVEKDL
ncbi:MAG TPA: hypothetical protein QF901_08535 [Gammaproteobacteria bacterium]|nr:hypothetical protein [Gammaproteobacteria bacterium]